MRTGVSDAGQRTCCRIYLFIFILLSVQFAFAQPDTIKYTGTATICTGGSKILTTDPAPAGAVYSWKLNSAPVGTGASYTASSPGTIDVTVNGNPFRTLVLTAASLPVAAFTADPSNQCASVPVGFTNTSTGNGPLTYLWNFDDPNSGAQNTSTAAHPIHRFVGDAGNANQPFNVRLTVTSVDGCINTTTRSVTIKQSPSTKLGGTGATTYNNKPYFTICSNVTSGTFSFVNQSTTSASNLSYTIVWGDASPNLTATSFTNTTHDYPLGTNTLLFIVSGQNGCTDTTTYYTFVGSNPEVSYGTPGNSSICTSNSLTFPISGISSNPPGTTYTITFNDGSPSQVYQHPPPASITHLFATNSCEYNTPTYTNSFSTTMTASNPCRSSQVVVSPIYVSDKPSTNFTISPKDTTCVNSPVTFTASGAPRYINNGVCAPGAVIWRISPATGWALSSGTLGNDYNLADPSLWLSGTAAIGVRFTVPGTYSISMKSGNPVCGSSSVTRTICVNPAPAGSFSLDVNSECAPFTVAATNTSAIPNCGNNTYTWSVNYAATAGCVPNTSGYTYTGGTSATSVNPQLQLAHPGSYTISLVAQGSGAGCTAPAVSSIVTVKAKPVANITAPATICQNVPVSPSAAVSCYTSPATYAWTFVGGIPASSTSASPGTVVYASAGTYPIELSVTNECGTTTVSKQIVVNPVASVTVPGNQSFCKGAATGGFTFSSTVPGTVFNWTNSHPGIGLGTSGTGNIPVFTAVNNTPNPITATITVTPVNSCSGAPATFTITVNPQPAAPVVVPVVRCQNDPVVPLTATALPNHTLNWYTDATGGTSTSTAPVPGTATVGTTTYYVSQTNTGGCESQRTPLAVTINPAVVIGTATVANPTNCGAATGSITISGLDPNTTYTVTYTKNGVPVSTTLTTAANGNLIIPGLTAGTYDSIRVSRAGCPSNVIGPYALSDPTAPPIPVAAVNSPVCSGTTVSLTASTTVAGAATYNWSGPNGFTSGTQNPNIVNATTAATGTYSVTVTVSGCTSPAADVSVTVNPTPANVTAAANSPLCSGDTIRLTSGSTTPGTIVYAWTGPNGYTGNSQNPVIPNAAPAMAGSYTLTATLGSCSAAPRNTTVTVNPKPVITDSSFTNPSGCTSGTGSIRLMGLIGNTSYQVRYLKNGVPVSTLITADAAGVIAITGLTSGTYTAVGVTSAGCSSNTVGPFVLVPPNPPATPTAGSNSPVCAGTILSLNATSSTGGNIIYNWSGPNGYSSNDQYPVISNAAVAASGVYTVTATISGCISAPATVAVVVTPSAAPASAGPDQQLCNQPSAVLAASQAGAGTGTWSVVAPSTATIAQLNNPSALIDHLPPGLTQAVWTITNGVCATTSDTIRIVNLEGVSNQITPLSSVVCNGQGITISGNAPAGGTGTYVYQWQQSTDNITFNNIPGAVSGSLTAVPVVNTYYRRRVVSGACTGYSDTALVTVLAGISSNLIGSDQAICINTVPAVLSGTMPSGGGGAFTYSWEQSTDNGLTWTTIGGATAQDYQPGAMTVPTRFRRRANTALCGGAQASTSNSIAISLNPDARALFNPAPTISCTPFVITPAVINLSPFANAVSEYRWYVNGNYIGSGTSFPGYTISNAGDSITIKLVAISRYGCKNDSTQQGFRTITRPVPVLTQTDSVGCGPLSVRFLNQTPDAGLYTYQWDFGNGQTSVLQQPAAVSFLPNPQSGDTVYQVRFRTISPCDTVTLFRFVRVKSRPKALFTPDRSTGCSNYVFSFSNTSRGIGNVYTWDFGDGSPVLSSNAAQVQHAYHVGNTTVFRVKLKAVNECGADSLIYNLVVQPASIRLDFAINGNERYGCLPHTVRFVNNSQGGSTFTWDFGDGSPPFSTYQNIDTITHVYNTAGTFTVKLRGTNSCSDTSDTELVTVYPKPAVAFTAYPQTACFGDTIRFVNNSDPGLAYSWHFGDGGLSPLFSPNHVYSTGGSYRVWLKATRSYPSGIGCTDSTFQDVLIRDTLPGSFFASDTMVRCVPANIVFKNNNGPSLLAVWDFGDGTTATGDSVSHTYTQPGTYLVKMNSKAVAGCVYRASRTIVVTSPGGTLLYTGGVLCPGMPLRMEVVPVNATQICYVFGDGDSVTTTSQVVYHTYPQPGIYVPYAYVQAGNCSIRLVRGDTVKADRLRTGFRSQQQQQCGATVVSFTDTSAGFFGIQAWRWDFGDGTFATVRHPVKTFTQAGTYQVRLRITSISGCVDTVTIPVVVGVRNYPAGSISGDSLACVGQPLALAAQVQSADALAGIDWSLGNGTTTSGAGVSAVYGTAGVYTIRMISRTAFGCADTVYKIIRVSPSPQISAGPDLRICRGQSIQLGATGATTWQWSPLQSLSCYTCPDPIASPPFTISYVVTGSNNGLCRVNDTVLVEVVQPFTMAVAPTDTLCVGDSVQLFATGAYTYTWNPAVSLNNAAISNPVARPNVTTLYQVVGKDRYNCFTDTDYVRINVGQYPVVDLGSGSVLTAGTTVQMAPVITNGPIARYTWTPATNLSCSNCPQPVAVINKDIVYRLEVENNLGCKGADTIHYKVNCDKSQLYVPTAFSPDNDGTNDVFMVRGKGIAVVHYFRIFNRWGQLVFERSNIAANDMTQGWDGKINGVPAQPDVYVVVAELVCTGGAIFPYQGNVTLVR